MDLANRTAVITGAASGIGRASAVALARAGCDVVLADINESRLSEAARAVHEAGRRALSVSCDVRQETEVTALADRALDAFGAVDVLMNNAGVLLVGPPEAVTVEDWQWMLDINLLGVVRGLRAFLPHMLSRGTGWVINTASSAGYVANATFNLPYTVSKFAVRGLTENLFLYLRPRGIGVTCLCPNLVATNLGESVRISGADPDAFGGRPDLREIGAEQVGELVVDAVRDERFLVLTHPEDAETIRRHYADIDAALMAELAGLATLRP